MTTRQQWAEGFLHYCQWLPSSEKVTALVAQTLVVALRRGPQDPELSPFLNHRNHLHPALHRGTDSFYLSLIFSDSGNI